MNIYLYKSKIKYKYLTPWKYWKFLGDYVIMGKKTAKIDIFKVEYAFVTIKWK